MVILLMLCWCAAIVGSALLVRHGAYRRGRREGYAAGRADGVASVLAARDARMSSLAATTIPMRQLEARRQEVRQWR